MGSAFAPLPYFKVILPLLVLVSIVFPDAKVILALPLSLLAGIALVSFAVAEKLPLILISSLIAIERPACNVKFPLLELPELSIAFVTVISLLACKTKSLFCKLLTILLGLIVTSVVGFLLNKSLSLILSVPLVAIIIFFGSKTNVPFCPCAADKLTLP